MLVAMGKDERGANDASTKPTHALYENDGSGKFTDVTKEKGLDITMYGMAPAFGDYDGDGWTDIFFTAVGKCRCFTTNKARSFRM